MEDRRRQEVRELARLTARFSAAQQAFFQAEYGRHRRNPTTALLLCTLLGGFGAHYFYFGRHRAGMLRLLLSWTLVPTILAFTEAPTMSARAMRYNASLANELLLALRETVHEQPAEVDTLQGVSAPVALESVQRAAIAPQSEMAAHGEAAESALIAAAWLGREPMPASAPMASEPFETAPQYPNGSVSGFGQTLDGYAARVNGSGQLVGQQAADGIDQPATEGAPTPASEYDAWFSTALHREVAAAPAADMRAYAEDLPSITPSGGAARLGGRPSEPRWASQPEWHAPSHQGQHADDANDWGMPDLSREWATPEISGDTAGAGEASAWPTSGAFQHEPTAAIEETSNPGIAAAVASAAAAWSAPAYDDLFGIDAAPAPARSDVDKREPVFMYQVAPAVRRDSVHYGPAASTSLAGAGLSPVASGTNQAGWAAGRVGHESLPHGLGDDVGLAALGSVLAAGLADLLRERPARPRTRPLTHPTTDTFRTLRSAQLSALAVHAEPALAADPDPWTPVSSQPVDTVPAWQPESGLAPAPVPSLNAFTPWAPPALLDADTTEYTADDLAAQLAPPDTVSARDETPESSPMLAEPVSAPTGVAAYVSTPLQHTRRRTLQRVIVRKMAMMAGQVVAEATVERQVPVVEDESEMAARLQAATLSAAREALDDLLRTAPREAAPAIQAQIHALNRMSLGVN